MNDFAQQRKADVAFSINENPVEITIERTEKKPKGGGREIVKSTVGPFVIRIFNQKGKDLGLVTLTQTAGIRQENRTYAFLADAETDIRCSPECADEFTAYGKRYRVTNVVERYWQGELTSKDGTLEEVS